MITRLKSLAEGCRVLDMPPDKAKEVADLVAATDGMIYHFYLGARSRNGKMSIAQAVGHKPMTSAEYKELRIEIGQ